MDSLEYKITLKEKIEEYRKRFILNNISNIVGKQIFLTEARDLSDEDFWDLYTLASDSLKQFEIIQSIIKDKEEAKKMNQYNGMKIENFPLITPDDKTVYLYDYIGDSEYLYLEWWASWCNPCKKAIPDLKKIYQEYHKKGLNILSISIDKGKTAWLNAVKEAGMPWPQLLYSHLDNTTDIRKKYYIYAIPRGILLNKNGEIISQQIPLFLLPKVLEAMKKGELHKQKIQED